MQKPLLICVAILLAISSYAQTNVPAKTDSTAKTVTIDYALMNRILSETDYDNSAQQPQDKQNQQTGNDLQMNSMTNHRLLNNQFKLCAKRLKMVTGKNSAYLIGFFNQILQSASHSILADGSNQERYMRVLHDTEDAITYALKYPSVDLEQEFASGKSKLVPLILY